MSSYAVRLFILELLVFNSLLSTCLFVSLYRFIFKWFHNMIRTKKVLKCMNIPDCFPVFRRKNEVEFLNMPAVCSRENEEEFMLMSALRVLFQRCGFQ
jgi:hypothetical protein